MPICGTSEVGAAAADAATCNAAHARDVAIVEATLEAEITRQAEHQPDGATTGNSRKAPYHASSRDLNSQGDSAMFVRVVRSRVDPAKIESDSQLTQDLAAAVKAMPGNQSFMGAVDRANGRAITISTWDTQEHASYSPDALGQVQSRVRAIVTDIDPPEIYEVIG
jgi:hypothetical protein